MQLFSPKLSVIPAIIRVLNILSMIHQLVEEARQILRRSDWYCRDSSIHGPSRDKTIVYSASHWNQLSGTEKTLKGNNVQIWKFCYRDKYGIMPADDEVEPKKRDSFFSQLNNLVVEVWEPIYLPPRLEEESGRTVLYLTHFLYHPTFSLWKNCRWRLVGLISNKGVFASKIKGWPRPKNLRDSMSPPAVYQGGWGVWRHYCKCPQAPKF